MNLNLDSVSLLSKDTAQVERHGPVVTVNGKQQYARDSKLYNIRCCVIPANPLESRMAYEGATYKEELNLYTLFKLDPSDVVIWRNKKYQITTLQSYPAAHTEARITLVGSL